MVGGFGRWEVCQGDRRRIRCLGEWERGVAGALGPEGIFGLP
jgi:hypothetical protein